MRHKLTLEISSQEGVKILQQLALQLGYVQKRGPMKGGGSISGMVEALARNELQISHRKDNSDNV